MENAQTPSLAVVILAAGKGTRMKSATPKVLHPVAGIPMLGHVIMAAQTLNPRHIVVVTGFGADDVEAYATNAFPTAPLTFVRQEQQLGTGHAVMQTEPVLKGFDGTVLIFSGDSLLAGRPDVLPTMLETHRSKGLAVTVLSANVPDPKGYGRLFMENGHLRNVEDKDCTDEQKRVTTVNTAYYVVENSALWALLPKVTNQNAQKEYYLPDIIWLAHEAGLKTGMAEVPCVREEIGMNNRAEIAQMEALWQQRKRTEMMMAGVTLVAPETVFFSADTQIANDVTIHPHVVFGPGVVVESGVTVLPFCHLEGCTVRNDAKIGPYSRLRPGTDVGEAAHIGNFVELKNTQFGARSNANHLSYVGDAKVGEDCNLGAVTVTANYNHFTKQKFATQIGQHTSTGSLTVLVAPVKLGNEVYVGAGTAIRHDIPDATLAVTKTETFMKHDYKAKVKDSAISKSKK
jgi:bifunctional UDP-N-acetylglucosamine pyrophosphorylase/glucosamine-1-phosphate N-acetyltransferase